MREMHQSGQRRERRGWGDRGEISGLHRLADGPVLNCEVPDEPAARGVR